MIAFPDTTHNTSDPRYPNKLADRIAIYLYSPVGTSVTVTGINYTKTVSLVGGRFTEVDLTDVLSRAPRPVVTESGAVSGATFTLVADDPIIAYCYMATKYGGEAWAPLAVAYGLAKGIEEYRPEEQEGRRVATLVDGVLSAGLHRIDWDARNLPAGSYYCRLRVGDAMQTRVMIVR